MAGIPKKTGYFLTAVLAAALGVLGTTAARPDFPLGRDLRILFNLFRDVSLCYVDSVDTERLLLAAADGMCAELDPYTELIPEKEMDEFETRTTGQYGGIGAMIRARGDYAAIARPYEGFAADRAGLVPGDRLLAVDGEDLRGLDIAEVSERLKGAPGTAVRLRVEKTLTGEREEIVLERERVTISGIPYYGIVAEGVGYIVHDDFSEGCGEDFRRAFAELKKQGIGSLIVDLRGNGGGILQEAVHILSTFVPQGTEVVSMRGRIPGSDATFRTRNTPLDTEIPIAVLIDGASASAAEIVAGTLQDLDRAVLVGRRTFGKGLVQSTRPLGYNACLKVTTAKYFIPSGRCIQALDYTRRDENGDVAPIPDSLVREYATAAGRKVYDGGGIAPDVPTRTPPVSAFAVRLYADGHIEDFADDFYRRHRESIDPDGFSLSGEEYDRFVRFMQDRDTTGEPETLAALETLRDGAEQEECLERIAPQIEAIEKALREGRQTDLRRCEKEIRTLLEDEIVLRYRYYAGMLRHAALRDEEVATAAEVLRDGARYREIVTRQDTPRQRP